MYKGYVLDIHEDLSYKNKPLYWYSIMRLGEKDKFHPHGKLLYGYNHGDNNETGSKYIALRWGKEHINKLVSGELKED